MSFRLKLSLSVLVLLGCLLLLNSYITQSLHFSVTLDTLKAEHLSTLQTNRQIIEKSIVTGNKKDTTIAYLALEASARLTEDNPTTIAVYLGNVTAYSNLPSGLDAEVLNLIGTEGGYKLVQTEKGRYYMLACTPLAISQVTGAYMAQAFDISNLFAMRNTQINNAIWLAIATLAVATAATWFLAGIITRPLRKLRSTSESIAHGNYTLRTNITTKDEVGSLSKSFDQMACAIQQTVEQLQDSVKQRDDFVTAFSHELKTPMTSMIGYAALLRKSQLEPEQQWFAANSIYRETQRLNQLSGKLMGLMGLKEGMFERQEMDTCQLLAELQAAYPHLPNLCDKPSPGLVAMGDYAMVQDLLRNLVDNAERAVKNTPQGTILVSCRLTDQKIVFSVEDNGCGIAEEDIPYLTQPFYRVDKSRSVAYGGSGIGLALCQRIAVLHNTTLIFESQPQKGTTVRFTLEEQP